MRHKNSVFERLKSIGRTSALSESQDPSDYNIYADVFLRTRADKTRIWMQQLKIKNLKNEIFLGEFPQMSALEARHLAACNRKLVARGLSPFPRKISDSDRQFRDQFKSLIAGAGQPHQSEEDESKTADVIPIQQGQKAAPLNLSPYEVKDAIDVQTQGTPKALFAAQMEILIADEEPTTYEELETASTLELVPAPMLPARNAELEVSNAGANLCVLAKALALNTQTPAQKDRIYKSCLALLDEHGPDVLDAACQQALVSGTSSLSAVVSIIRQQHDDDTEFQPNTPRTIAHANIRGAGYFN